jgi:hypothetical protein
MALIEAADDYFDLISAKARQNEIPLDEAKRLLATLYIDQIGEEPQFQKSSSIILDSLRSTLPEDLREGITLLLAAESYIVDKIKSRAAEAALYKQPVILLLYWLAKHKPASLKQLWPLDPNSIRPIYVDLGIAYDNDR